MSEEPGTEQYVLHRSTKDPNTFFVTERYTDQAAFDAHAGSEALRGARRERSATASPTSSSRWRSR